MVLTAYSETEHELHQPEAQNNHTAELFGQSHALAGGFQELAVRGLDVIPASPLGVTTLTESGAHLTVRQTAASETPTGTQDSPDGVLAAAAMCCVEKLCIVGGACPTGKDVKDYTQAELNELSKRLSVSSKKAEFVESSRNSKPDNEKKGPDPTVIEAFAARFKAVAQMKAENGKLENTPETEAQIQKRAEELRKADKQPEPPQRSERVPVTQPQLDQSEDSAPKPERVVPDHLKRFMKKEPDAHVLEEPTINPDTMPQDRQEQRIQALPHPEKIQEAPSTPHRIIPANLKAVIRPPIEMSSTHAQKVAPPSTINEVSEKSPSQSEAPMQSKPPMDTMVVQIKHESASQESQALIPSPPHAEEKTLTTTFVQQEPSPVLQEQEKVTISTTIRAQDVFIEHQPRIQDSTQIDRKIMYPPETIQEPKEIPQSKPSLTSQTPPEARHAAPIALVDSLLQDDRIQKRMGRQKEAQNPTSISLNSLTQEPSIVPIGKIEKTDSSQIHILLETPPIQPKKMTAAPEPVIIPLDGSPIQADEMIPTPPPTEVRRMQLVNQISTVSGSSRETMEPLHEAQATMKPIDRQSVGDSYIMTPDITPPSSDTQELASHLNIPHDPAEKPMDEAPVQASADQSQLQPSEVHNDNQINPEQEKTGSVKIHAEISGSIFVPQDLMEKPTESAPLVIQVKGEKQPTVEEELALETAEQKVEVDDAGDERSSEVYEPISTAIRIEDRLQEPLVYVGQSQDAPKVELPKEEIVTLFSHSEIPVEPLTEAHLEVSLEDEPHIETSQTMISDERENAEEPVQGLDHESSLESQNVIEHAKATDFVENEMLETEDIQMQQHPKNEQDVSSYDHEHIDVSSNDEVSHVTDEQVQSLGIVEDEESPLHDKITSDVDASNEKRVHVKIQAHDEDLDEDPDLLEKAELVEKQPLDLPEFLDVVVSGFNEIIPTIEEQTEAHESTSEPILYMIFPENTDLSEPSEFTNDLTPQDEEHSEIARQEIQDTQHEEMNNEPQSQMLRVLPVAHDHLHHMIEHIVRIEDLLKELTRIQENGIDGLFDNLFDDLDAVTPEELRNDNAGQYDDTVVVLWYALTILRILGIAMILLSPDLQKNDESPKYPSHNTESQKTQDQEDCRDT